MVSLPRARSSADSQPCQLFCIDSLDDAGVDAEEREAIRLELEERRALKPGRDAVFAAADAQPLE